MNDVDATARVAIVDDHQLARAGLRSVLRIDPSLELVGEASTGREAVQLVRRLRPDLVLMDVRMPDMDGLEATRAIKRERPETKVLIVTMHDTPTYLLEALRAGAAGFVLKEATEDEILSAVRQVLSGESPLDPDLAARLLRNMAQGGTPLGPGDAAPDLTPREHDVLELLVQGKTNAEIGWALGLSINTVKVHVDHIRGKLDASDRTQAAVRAVQLGLVTPAAPED